jgi:hypothetical protein
MLERIVLPCGYGQTCNQLIVIAHWIPAVLDHGLALYFPDFRRYSRFFGGSSKQAVPSFPAAAPALNIAELSLALACARAARTRCFGNLGVRCCFAAGRLLPGVRQFAWDGGGASRSKPPRGVVSQTAPRARSLWVRGWLYRESTFTTRERAEIKRYFAPVPEIADRVRQFVNRHREPGVALVGVHLRRGDYRSWLSGRYYYDDREMANVMIRLRSSLPQRRLRFMLVSNEPVDAALYHGIDIVRGPGDALADLYSLASCDLILGPPSTYTTWASFYGDAPLYHITDTKAPFGPGDFHARHECP